MGEVFKMESGAEQSDASIEDLSSPPSPGAGAHSPDRRGPVFESGKMRLTG